MYLSHVNQICMQLIMCCAVVVQQGALYLCYGHIIIITLSHKSTVRRVIVVFLEECGSTPRPVMPFLSDVFFVNAAVIAKGICNRYR